MCTISATKDKTIINAFIFFTDRLDSLTDDKLLATRDALINIGYVNIISSTEEDSYTIFEILNARGLDLEDHELLKNYIMRYLQPVERRDDAKRIWEEIENHLDSQINTFLRHYAIHKYNYDRDKKSTISVYKTIQNISRGRNVDRLLDDINTKSQYYKLFLNPSECTGFEGKVFSFFKSKRIVIFRPFLLTLKHLVSLERITAEKYTELLKFLYEFYICYNIIGQENSNMLSGSIYKYAYELEKEYSETKIDEFIDSMRKKLPSLELFINSFRNLGFSHHWPIYKDSKNKERCQLVLNLIEEYVSGREINIDVTIEHILPDSERIENAQIGNLFFLEEDLNHKCDNKSLEEKFDIYNESSLMCPKGFASRYRGKEFDPSSRTDFLAKLIYNNVLNITGTEQG